MFRRNVKGRPASQWPLSRRWSAQRHVMVAGLLMLLAYVPLAAGCSDEESGHVVPAATAGASESPGTEPSDFGGGSQDQSVKYATADADAFGRWVTIDLRGISAEIPLNENWDVRIILDPCFGDVRYYVLLEEIATKERIKVDFVDPKVTSTSVDPTRLEALTERILRSIKGTHRVPETVKTFGPLPTEVYCEGDAVTVPTLTPDEFTPPAVTPDPRSDRPQDTNEGVP